MPSTTHRSTRMVVLDSDSDDAGPAARQNAMPHSDVDMVSPENSPHPPVNTKKRRELVATDNDDPTPEPTAKKARIRQKSKAKKTSTPPDDEPAATKPRGRPKGKKQPTPADVSEDDEPATNKASAITKQAANATNASLVALVDNLERSRLTLTRLELQKKKEETKMLEKQAELEELRNNRLKLEKEVNEERQAQAMELQEARSHTMMLQIKLAQYQKENVSATFRRDPSPTRAPLAPMQSVFGTAMQASRMPSASSTSTSIFGSAPLTRSSSSTVFGTSAPSYSSNTTALPVSALPSPFSFPATGSNPNSSTTLKARPSQRLRRLEFEAENP
ncbi:hypothetical protein DFH06DRAFT_1167410 [Mycena polygramma]|nr:hypothetical protein DFH06DRAFT_1167410 [Mycena polygramma]